VITTGDGGTRDGTTAVLSFFDRGDELTLTHPAGPGDAE
jgi:hypothetical protein